MVRKYFGTDGIRGRANGVITPELALKVGQASGLAFRRGDHRHRVVIGKDTRLSGYMIETALIAGFTSVGMDVLQVGPMPTPAVAMLTRRPRRHDLGFAQPIRRQRYQTVRTRRLQAVRRRRA
jgi:phosphoglucosamine mutase